MGGSGRSRRTGHPVRLAAVIESIALPESVGWTALNTAIHRVRESQRPDALFDDVFSAALVEVVSTGDSGEAPRVTDAGGSDEGTRVFGDYVALRTHFIDESLRVAIQDGIGQIVLLGAGLDGRAYRLPWAEGTRLFELDTTEMLQFKQAVVERVEVRPRTEVVFVAGDLTEDWPIALGDAGFSPDRSTVWVVEGLLGYLTPAENDRLMARVSQGSAPGSRLIAVYAAGDPLTVLRLGSEGGDQATDYLGGMVTVGPGAEPEPWLAGHGWRVSTTTVAEHAKRTGRPVPLAMDPSRGGVECWLVDARRTGD